MARYPMICILFLYIIFPLLIKSTQFYLLACSALSYHLVSYTISFLRVSHPLSAVSDTIRDLQPQICSLQRQPYTWSCNQQAVWNDNPTVKASTGTSRSATTKSSFCSHQTSSSFCCCCYWWWWIFVCFFLCAATSIRSYKTADFVNYKRGLKNKNSESDATEWFCSWKCAPSSARETISLLRSSLQL